MNDRRVGDTAAQVALALAQAAMQRGDWQAVIEAFPDRAGLAPAAHEIMAHACCALFDPAAMQRHMAAAIAGYSAHGSHADVARTVLGQARGRLMFEGDPVECPEPIEQAARRLASLEECAGHGWLEQSRALGVHFPRHDFEAVRASAQRAHAIGVRHADHALEAEGLAAMGCCAISLGQVADGLRQLDHSASMAASGYVRDPMSVAAVVEQMLCACEWIEDYTRSEQWFRTIERMHAERPLPLLVGLACPHLAHAMIERGEWGEAERVLAIEGMASGVVRTQLEAERGLLRLRQGRLDEAEARYSSGGMLPRATLCLATIAFERGETVTACELLERQLRDLPTAAIVVRYRIERSLALMRAATDDLAGAEAAAQAVERFAATAGTPATRAAAAHVWGRIALLRGEHAQAQVQFERAIDGARQAGLPAREAVSRIGLGEALVPLGHEAAGRAEQEQGTAILRRLGASASEGGLHLGLFAGPAPPLL